MPQDSSQLSVQDEIEALRREAYDAGYAAAMETIREFAAHFAAGNKTAALPIKKDPVLRAKPVKGEVDWSELSREHIARYPKIRARLAE